MRAVRFHEHGPSSVLRYEVAPDPVPARGEVLVRVRAVSVNRNTDIALREKAPPFPLAMPHIMGIDPAGVREDTGERVVVISSLWCGECEWCRRGLENACVSGRIVGMHTQGGYAELIAVPEQNLLPIPDSLSFEDATAAIAMFPIAWHLLMDRARLARGEWVLVMAAGGSLGVAGLQVAKRAGARVIAAAGADWKLERCMVLGAEHTVNYATARLSDEVKRITGGRGVDVVFENISSPELWPESVASLAIRGRLVTSGAHGGGVVPLDVRTAYRKHISVHTSAGAPIAQLREAMSHVGSGAFRSVIHARLPLAEAAKAQDLVIARDAFGRVVLEI